MNFSVDDRANQVYGAGDLRWKGSFAYDAGTGRITRDPTWGGPFPELFDDGPWDGEPAGHEPSGATAGDHVWSVSVSVQAPDQGEDQYEYGLTDASYGDAWIWEGANGMFAVPAGATEPIEAAGMVFPAFGQIDLRLTLDLAHLDPAFEGVVVSAVVAKSTAWNWIERPAATEAGIASILLSANVGPGTDLPHNGLLHSGDRTSFIFVLDGVEYRQGAPLSAGVGAEYRTPGGEFQTLALENDGQTLSVVVP